MTDSTITRCRTCGSPTVEWWQNPIEAAVTGAKRVKVTVCALCDRRVCGCGRVDVTGKALRCVTCRTAISKPSDADLAGLPITLDAPND